MSLKCVLFGHKKIAAGMYDGRYIWSWCPRCDNYYNPRTNSIKKPKRREKK